MITPIPDRPEAAAVACEDLAEQLGRGVIPTAARIQDVATSLDWVPLPHCERDPVDRVLDMAAAVRAGKAAADGLRALAAALRAGRDAMLATGWTKTLGGGS